MPLALQANGVGVGVGVGVAQLGRHVHLAPTTSRVADRLLLAQGGNGSSIPAGGDVWPTAIYWTFVQVGTPPQTFPVAIDSGSGDLDISGKGCDGCVTTPPNNLYDHSASSTSRAAPPFGFSNTYQTCDLSNPTAPCTISGKLYKDKVSLAGFRAVDVVLGSIERQTSNFDQFKAIDGVMGFTMPSDKNVFSTMVQDGVCDNVWAMCMSPGSKSNGTITIGGVDPRLSDNVSYVKDSGMGFHAVEVEAISLGKSGGGLTRARTPVGESAILDTGTNVLLLPSHVMKELQQAMCADSTLAHCDEFWSGKCFSLTSSQVAAYPPLTLELSTGLGLHMSAADYLLQNSPLAPAAEFCLGIRDGGSAGGSGFIIGDTTMRNYYLVFDLAEKQIGWGPVNRENCGSIE